MGELVPVIFEVRFFQSLSSSFSHKFQHGSAGQVENWCFISRCIPYYFHQCTDRMRVQFSVPQTSGTAWEYFLIHLIMITNTTILTLWPCSTMELAITTTS